MSYLPTWIALASGLVLLVVVIVRLTRHVRRFSATAAAVNARFNDSTGHLKARSAALRVAVTQQKTRWRSASKETGARVKHTSVDVPSWRRGRQEDDRG
jgi:hypothetical protein